jgi:hypothetical protein
MAAILDLGQNAGIGILGANLPEKVCFDSKVNFSRCHFTL